MKFHYHYLLFCFLLVTFSCKKKDNPTPTSNGTPSGSGTPKIKTVSANGGPTSTYTYGSDGKVTLISVSDGSKSTFQYSSNIVIEHGFNAGGTDTGDITYYLGKNGLADSSMTINNGVVTYSNYTYNTSGFLTRQRTFDAIYDRQIFSTYVISGGNTVSETDTNYIGGYEVVSSTFQFDTNHTYTTSNQNQGQPWLGFVSTNAQESGVAVELNTGDQIKYSYQNTYDTQGRTINETITLAFYYSGGASAGSQTHTATFTYY